MQHLKTGGEITFFDMTEKSLIKKKLLGKIYYPPR